MAYGWVIDFSYLKKHARLRIGEYLAPMKPGTIVRLRGGDRPMVIVSTIGNCVDCAWYEGLQRIVGEFEIASLEECPTLTSTDIDQPILD